MSLTRSCSVGLGCRSHGLGGSSCSMKSFSTLPKTENASVERSLLQAFSHRSHFCVQFPSGGSPGAPADANKVFNRVWLKWCLESTSATTAITALGIFLSPIVEHYRSGPIHGKAQPCDLPRLPRAPLAATMVSHVRPLHAPDAPQRSGQAIRIRPRSRDGGRPAAV